MHFRLAPMTLDDLELAIGPNFRGISRDFVDWEATTAKRMKIVPQCQRVNCSPLNVLFSDV